MSRQRISAPELCPTNHVKFLCSHGGNILPRPSDGHLKYIGGETRVISVVRHVTFPELMKKITSIFNGEMILKYQLIPDDLDVLVTVKSDEDVRHMFDECDRHEHLLRAFLFPANVMSIDQQRCINSGFSVSSACSSPKTPSATKINNPESVTGTKSSLPIKTRSSPSLCNLVATASPNMTQNHHHQPQPQPLPHHFHPQPYQPLKPPLDRHLHKTAGTEHVCRHTNRGEEHMYHQRGCSSYDAYYGNCRCDRTTTNVPSSSSGFRSGR